MMQTTRREMLIGSASITLVGTSISSAAYAQAPSTVLPVFDEGFSVSIGDTTIGSSGRLAQLPVTLSAPPNRTIVVEYSVRRGASESATNLAPLRGQVIFQPGEQKKLIEVPLLCPLQTGEAIEVQLADFRYPWHTYAKKIGRIISSESAAFHATSEDVVELPPLPTGGSVVFSDDLLDPHFASDSGFRPDGMPCWQSRFNHGRRHDSNRELGYYADPALNPETTVWGVASSTGHRFIQAERMEKGLSDGNGGKLMLGWQKDASFKYSAAIITSRTLFDRITTDSYVEFNVKMAKVVGSWPALWLKRANDTWPPEIDLLEAFITSADFPSDAITSSIHWVSEKGHQTYGATVPLAHFESDANIFSRFNRFGCLIAEKQIVYYFNGKPYCAMPNLVGPGPWYMLIDVAVGGVAGEPDPRAFPAAMQIAGVKVVQFS